MNDDDDDDDAACPALNKLRSFSLPISISLLSASSTAAAGPFASTSSFGSFFFSAGPGQVTCDNRYALGFHISREPGDDD